MRILDNELIGHASSNAMTSPNSLAMNRQFGEGMMTTIPVKENVWVSSWDFTFNKDTCVIPKSPKKLHGYALIYICLSGGIQYTFRDRAFHIKNDYSGVSVSEPYNLLIKEEYKKDSRLRMVSVLFDRDTFFAMTGKKTSEIYRLFNLELSGRKRKIPPGMRSVAEQLLMPPPDGVDRNLFLEAKVIEFVSYKLGILDRYRPIERKSEPEYASLNERVYYAAELLERRMDDPPGIFDLARDAGLNQINLTQGFKDIFGHTPYQYLSKIRLRKAAKLIASREQNVTEAAFSVGYSNLSHFAKIFRHEFGVNPSEYSKHWTGL